MPYIFDWEPDQTVYVRFLGVVTDGDATIATDSLYGDSRVDSVRKVIWDFTEIDDFNVTQDQVETIAAIDSAASEYMAPVKSAFVIKHPALIELATSYIATMRELGSPWQNRLFSSVAEARRWLSA